MSNCNTGKYLENLVAEYYAGLMLTSVVATRLPDSRSARNLIKAQNADFLVSSKASGAFHLECKSVGGIKKILKKPAQYAAMKRWAEAGTEGFFLVHLYDLNIYSYLRVSTLSQAAKSWPLTTELGSVKDTLKAIMAEAACLTV